ncbi:MAG: hypothetical protein CMJ94_06365 [Planctomycetes bacterium]|nr:hypothetical protein [Planctomycetota bacterium]
MKKGIYTLGLAAAAAFLLTTSTPAQAGGGNESDGVTWTTLATNFDPMIWGEQAKDPDRIMATGPSMREIQIQLLDGDTSVAGPSDWDRERAELFLWYRVIDQWFDTHNYMRLRYEISLGEDFDPEAVAKGTRRVFQVKATKGSGKPIFDVVVQGGLLQIRHNETPTGGKPVILAEARVPDPRRLGWVPIEVEAKFTETADGYFKMRIGNLYAEFHGATQHDARRNNIKIGEYRNQEYSSGTQPHRLRNPVLQVGQKTTGS